MILSDFYTIVNVIPTPQVLRVDGIQNIDGQRTQMQFVNPMEVQDLPHYTSLQIISPEKLGWDSKWKDAILLHPNEHINFRYLYYL